MKCPTENCEETISESSKKLYCKNCRSGMYYWSRKTPAQIKQRDYQLVKLRDRISNRKQRKDLRNGVD